MRRRRFSSTLLLGLLLLLSVDAFLSSLYVVLMDGCMPVRCLNAAASPSLPASFRNVLILSLLRLTFTYICLPLHLYTPPSLPPFLPPYPLLGGAGADGGCFGPPPPAPPSVPPFPPPPSSPSPSFPPAFPPTILLPVTKTCWACLSMAAKSFLLERTY